MIGIFGGTFDPVHYGHIKPALSIKQALNLTQLRFIPNRIPPHREAPWLSVEQRLALLKTALQDYTDIRIDERELSRDGQSFMVDTLRSLQHDFPDETLCLIIGMDAFIGLNSWHQWRSLFDLCHLVVTTRPGFDQNTMAAQMMPDDYQFLSERITQDINEIRSKATGKILLKSVPQLDISSTRIRAKLLAGEDVSDWMPKAAYLQLRGFIKNDN